MLVYQHLLSDADTRGFQMSSNLGTFVDASLTLPAIDTCSFSVLSLQATDRPIPIASLHLACLSLLPVWVGLGHSVEETECWFVNGFCTGGEQCGAGLEPPPIGPYALLDKAAGESKTITFESTYIVLCCTIFLFSSVAGSMLAFIYGPGRQQLESFETQFPSRYPTLRMELSHLFLFLPWLALDSCAGHA